MAKILLGLSGRGTIDGKFASTARVGKDEVAKVIRDDFDFRTYSFALPLKQVSQVLFGLSEEQMWNDKLKNVPVEPWGLSPRTIFQRVGTEAGRLVFDESMWAKMAMLVWDDVQQGKPYALTHTANVSEFGPAPQTPEDFDKMLDMAVQTMLQLDPSDIAQSRLMNSPLANWPFSFEEVKALVIEKSIPRVLGLEDGMTRDSSQWQDYVAKRSTLPMVVRVGCGPYGVPSGVANGLVVPDVSIMKPTLFVRTMVLLFMCVVNYLRISNWSKAMQASRASRPRRATCTYITTARWKI